MTVTITELALTAYGIPAGQGNLRTNKGGRSYHANAKELDLWREAVAATACAATDRHAFAPVPGQAKECARCRVLRPFHGLFLGPVRLEAVVTVAKPKTTAPDALPITRSSTDWDHHGRAISDALTGIAYADDSQIVDGRVIKTFPDRHPQALARPGASIRITLLDTPRKP